MIIADIGINHNGDMNYISNAIFYAWRCGADVVKFQKRTPSAVFTPEHLDSPSCSYEGETWRETWDRWELSEEQYDAIDAECREKDIKWTASVWDRDSLDFILKYDVPFIKISSASIADIEFLRYVNVTSDRPVHMSIGASTIGQIRDAAQAVNPDVMYHCQAEYPTPYENVNLRAIQKWRADYPHIIWGLSLHTGDELPAIMGIMKYGIAITEVHLKLNNESPDAAASINPLQLEHLCKMDKWAAEHSDDVDGSSRVVTTGEANKMVELRGYLK